MEERRQPVVIAQSERFGEEAKALAGRLGIAFYGVPEEASSRGIPADAEDVTLLRLGDDGLSLCSAAASFSDGKMTLFEITASLRADLTTMGSRLGKRRLVDELLVRAANVKGDHKAMVAVDATAGFGEDSMLLAAAGFHVRMYECNPYIAALLEDAMKRAREIPALAPVLARMELTCGDSIPALRQMQPSPEVVYLDPMFPERTKSAAVGKKFQLLHRLEAPCPNEEELLAAAMAAHPRRIVIKRPLKGDRLAGVKPSFSISGKAVRYDGIDPISFGGGNPAADMV